MNTAKDPIYKIQWPDGDLQIYIRAELKSQFNELVRRALNTWPDAHPALKELGDLLDHGKILQDYWSQRSDI